MVVSGDVVSPVPFDCGGLPFGTDDSSDFFSESVLAELIILESISTKIKIIFFQIWFIYIQSHLVITQPVITWIRI